MQRQVRKCPVQILHHAEILDKDRVETGLVVRTDVVRKDLHFLVLEKRIDRHVDTDAAQMRVVDSGEQLVLSRVVRVGPCAEEPASDIDRVRTGRDHRLEALEGPRRRK